MKRHEKKTYSIDYHSIVDIVALEKNVLSQMKEFERKIELGRNLKIIINECGVNIHALPSDMKEALNTYELYGERN